MEGSCRQGWLLFNYYPIVCNTFIAQCVLTILNELKLLALFSWKVVPYSRMVRTKEINL